MTPLEQLATLTEREREVFDLVVEGRTPKEIARELGMAIATANTHRARLYRKLGAHSAIDVLRFARACGLPVLGS